MDFFTAQDVARRRSHLLVGLFAAAVVSIVAAVYLVVVLTLGAVGPAGTVFDPFLFAIVALGTGTLIGLGSLYRTSQLRAGGGAVAAMLGGRPIARDTKDLDERKLMNVVEEMAIAAGTPVPDVFVLEGEESINAFAAGHGLHDAAVAVTRGGLRELDRDELQGVVAHEFSHILNGDMRLNVRLVGLLFGILLLAVVGRGFLRGSWMSGRRRGRGGGDGRAAVLGLALVVLGYIGVFFGKLIKSAVSRQREFLADAAAVQFTRNPEGLAGALKKIGAHAGGARVADHHAEELSHLFFADAVGSALGGLTATHPPLDQRIRALEPGWDGSYETRKVRPGAEAAGNTSQKGREGAGAEGARGAGAREGEGALGALPGGKLTSPAGAALLLGTVGALQYEQVAHARRVMERIPRPLLEAAHERDGAAALLLALLGGDDEASRRARTEAAEELRKAGLFEEGDPGGRLEELRLGAVSLEPGLRLPLVDLTVPTLRDLPAPQSTALRSAAEKVTRAEGRIRPFEFALAHILWRHLPGGGSPRRRGRERRLSDLRGDLALLLTMVARAGADDEDGARLAFEAGAAASGLPSGALRFIEGSEADLAAVDAALSRLEQGELDARRRILQACAAAAASDEVLRAEEGELLRAIAECLELPLPPLPPVASGPARAG